MKKSGMPWFRKERNQWVVWHCGKQITLAKGKENKAAAFVAFGQLLGTTPAEPESAPEPKPLTVAEIVSEYLTDVKGRIRPNTYVSYDCVLKPFVAAFGSASALALDCGTVERWSKSMKWSQTTQRFCLTIVACLLKWAVKTKRLPANPLIDLKRPAGRSRGTETLIDDDLHQRLLSVVSPQFAQFITAVKETGARAGEVARVEGQHVVWDASVWVLPDHKTVNKTERVRIIHLPETVLTLCRELAVVHPTGLLFRTTQGKKWSNFNWKQAMMRAQVKLGLEKRPLCSGYRHTFATNLLVAGVSDAQVAELLGHVGTTMVAKHYGHLGAKAAALKEALAKLR